MGHSGRLQGAVVDVLPTGIAMTILGLEKRRYFAINPIIGIKMPFRTRQFDLIVRSVIHTRGQIRRICKVRT